jgi:DNA-binding IclR family transcriptional regulator
VRILDAFRPGEVTLRVTDIAIRADLHLATASRLVAELVEHGLLSRDANRRVRIGLRLWELGSRASPALSLREAAMPFLEDLHAVVGHHVQIGVLDGQDVLFVERLSAPGAVVNYTRVAGRLPLHASSSGQVLLAHAGRDLQEKVLAGPLERFTARTIIAAGDLRATLAAVRREGYALCPGHIHEQALGVAVPVVDARGGVVATLSAVVPNDGGGRALIPVLRTAARGVTRALTGRQPPSMTLAE